MSQGTGEGVDEGQCSWGKPAVGGFELGIGRFREQGGKGKSWEACL